jgi:hypothetical protein
MNDSGRTSTGSVRSATRLLLVATLAFVSLISVRATVFSRVVAAPTSFQTAQSAPNTNAPVVVASIPFDLVNNHVVLKIRVNQWANRKGVDSFRLEQVVAYEVTIRRGTQVLQLKLTPRQEI